MPKDVDFLEHSTISFKYIGDLTAPSWCKVHAMPPLVMRTASLAVSDILRIAEQVEQELICDLSFRDNYCGSQICNSNSQGSLVLGPGYVVAKDEPASGHSIRISRQSNSGIPYRTRV
jgi:hypothetical protein